MAYDYARPINVIAPELVSALAMAQADLARPIVYFTSATVSTPEGNTGTKNLTITARRSTLSGTLNVTGNFVQGTAGAADFAGNVLPGNKVWAFSAGSDTATVDIAISGDTDVESDDTFGYTLQPGSGYRLGAPSSVTGTILNDDAAQTTPTLSGMPALQAKRNAGQRAILGMIGTSMTSGWGAGVANGTGDGTTAGSGGNSLRSKSWPQQLAAQLTAAGVSTRSDAYFSGLQATDTIATLTAYNPRVSFASGWSVNDNDSAGGKIVVAQNSMGAMTFTPEIAADRFDIFVTGFNGLATVEVRDSSGLLLTINESTTTGAAGDVTVGSSAFRKVTASRSTPSTLPITIAKVNTDSSFGFVVGIIPYDTTNPRVEIVNLGWPGSRAYGTDFNTPHWNIYSTGGNAWHPYYSIAGINADAFFIELGHNDVQANTSAADYQTALTNIANRAKLNGANVALIKGNTALNSQYNLPASYLAAIDSVTSSLSLRPVLNFNAISLVTADRYDPVHLSGAGYAKDAAAAKTYLN